MKRLERLAGYITLFVLGFLSCALILRVTEPRVYNAGATSRGRENISEALAQQPTRAAAAASWGQASAVAEAAARVEPAVVNIDISGRGEAPGGPFGFLQGGYGAVQGSGSGIILSGDGYIVTNNHVVEPIARSGGDIKITLDNGKAFTNVAIVGRDVKSDLAVLKIRGVRNLPAAVLGDSDKLRVGDWAIAVGNPLGFNSTVTLGIISALNRRDFRVERDALDRVIQTDAAINPGNSGGALADISGHVVGINTAIASSTGASVGIGFAIPINPARRIFADLIQKGEVVRPYLGVNYSPLAGIDRDEVRRRKPGVVLPGDDKGAMVVEPRGGGWAVFPGSPADRAGLRPYDVIREVGGRVVEDVDTIKDEVQKRRVGDKIDLKVWRAGRSLVLTVTLAKMPENFGVAAPSGFPGGGGGGGRRFRMPELGR